MVAYIYRSEEKIWRPRYEAAAPMGLPVLRVALPPQYSPRRLERLAWKLYRRGIRRFWADGPSPELAPLTPISPLPLLRAKGAEFALALLPGLPLWERRVALRGERVGAEAWRLAETLCPQVGALILDFDRGKEELSDHLRKRYGAAPLHLGWSRPPQATIELDPRQTQLPQTLRLWGEPDLQGLTLLPAEPLPDGRPTLPFLELLWETGRVELEGFRVVRRAEWP